jgi:hypothetical protein
MKIGERQRVAPPGAPFTRKYKTAAEPPKRLYIRFVLTHQEYDKGNGKMTASAEPQINPQRYAALLSQTLPKAITTEEENDHYLEIVNGLMAKAT